MKKVLLSVLALLLSACQGGTITSADTPALDGVWRGAVSDDKGLESMQAHVLDGLLLAVSQDQQRAHSGELVLDDGDLGGILAMRDELGEREQDYSVIGYADPYDVMQADLIGGRSDGELSLHYDLARSDYGASYLEVAGLYYLDAPGLQLSLAIDESGLVDGYDDAGCAYYGRLQVPDWRVNVYQISLDIDGCALAGEYAFGIASLRFDRDGWPELVLPVWLDEQDRVEPWVLQRVS